MTVLTSGAAGNLREQILSAAASCFRERGIKATKMQEIATRRHQRGKLLQLL